MYLADIWPSEAEIAEIVAAAIGAEMFTESYADVFAGDEEWQSLPTPEGETFAWQSGENGMGQSASWQPPGGHFAGSTDRAARA